MDVKSAVPADGGDRISEKAVNADIATSSPPRGMVAIALAAFDAMDMGTSRGDGTERPTPRCAVLHAARCRYCRLRCRLVGY